MSLFDWHARTDGSEPAGLVAAGPAMHAVLRALRGREAASVQGLTLAATRDLLVLLGPAAKLPWADGVAYCAPAPDVPGLWLPTRLAAAAPAELLHAALRRHTGHAAMLLWPDPVLVLGLDGAQPLQPALLDWLEKEAA